MLQVTNILDMPARTINHLRDGWVNGWIDGWKNMWFWLIPFCWGIYSTCFRNLRHYRFSSIRDVFWQVWNHQPTSYHIPRSPTDKCLYCRENTILNGFPSYGCFLWNRTDHMTSLKSPATPRVLLTASTIIVTWLGALLAGKDIDYQ